MSLNQSKTVEELIEELRQRNPSGVVILIDNNGHWNRSSWGSIHSIYGLLKQLIISIEHLFLEEEKELNDSDE